MHVYDCTMSRCSRTAGRMYQSSFTRVRRETSDNGNATVPNAHNANVDAKRIHIDARLLERAAAKFATDILSRYDM